jgi:hypothetical protein
MAGELPAGLVDRGLDFNQPRVYIRDGAKALSAGKWKRVGQLISTTVWKSRVGRVMPDVLRRS